jgi:quinol monooxygenase YgiN
MFTRFVTCVTTPDKKEKLTSTLNDEILPMLKKHAGFTDLVVLTPETNNNTVLAISFWNTKADAEKYVKETFARVTELLKPYLTTAPEVTTYNVEASTLHHIAAGKAA